MHLDFIDQAQNGRSGWQQYLITVLITLGTAILASNAAFTVLGPLLEDSVNKAYLDSVFNATLVGVMSLLSALALYACNKLIHKRTIASLNYVRGNLVAELFEGVAVGGLAMLLGLAIFQINIFQNMSISGITNSGVVILLVGIIGFGLQVYFEELVFRGYLLQGLALLIKNRSLLFVVSALIFAIVHVFGGGIQVALSTFLPGLLFCYVVSLRQNLSFATGVHFANNFIAVFLFNLALEGQVIPEASGEVGFFAINWVDLASTALTVALVLIYLFIKDKLMNNSQAI